MRVSRSQHGGTRDNRALLAYRGYATKGHIFDLFTRQTIAVANGSQNLRREVDGRYFMQRAIGPPLATRATHRIIDIGFGHIQSLFATTAPAAISWEISSAPSPDSANMAA